MHEYLAIVIGFEPVPGDTASAEQPIQVLTLTGSQGFALDPNEGWMPQLPALKNGGVWAESSISLGRTLIAGQDSNVTESMRLSIGTGDPLLLHSYIVKLNRFIELARQHWTTFYQTLPVYLKWKAISGKGYQYALIYNIDHTIEYPGTENTGVVDVTLSIEREPYWRAIPPGANPKRYYYEKNNLQWNKANAKLDSGADHFKVDTVENRQEWSSGFASEISSDYLEVSGIPGDAPALLCLTLRGTAPSSYIAKKVYVARSTKNTPLTARSGSTGIRRYNILNACDGALGPDAALANDTGAPKLNTTGVNRRIEVSFTTTTTLFTRVGWTSSNNINATLLRGKYSVLLRMRQVGGTFGQITVQVDVYTGNTINAIQSFTVNPTVIAGTGNTSGWPLHYLGDVTIPVNSRGTVSSQGYGESVQAEADNTIFIQASRSAGAGVLYLSDLIFLPIDEGAFSAEAVTYGFISGTHVYPVIIDNTGYLVRGINEAAAWNYDDVVFYPREPYQIKGDVFSLEPGVTNRLYFLTVGQDNSVENRSEVASSIDVLVNIVPRWRGVRDA